MRQLQALLVKERLVGNDGLRNTTHRQPVNLTIVVLVVLQRVGSELRGHVIRGKVDEMGAQICSFGTRKTAHGDDVGQRIVLQKVAVQVYVVVARNKLNISIGHLSVQVGHKVAKQFFVPYANRERASLGGGVRCRAGQRV